MGSLLHMLAEAQNTSWVYNVIHTTFAAHFIDVKCQFFPSFQPNLYKLFAWERGDCSLTIDPCHCASPTCFQPIIVRINMSYALSIPGGVISLPLFKFLRAWIIVWCPFSVAQPGYVYYYIVRKKVFEVCTDWKSVFWFRISLKSDLSSQSDQSRKVSLLLLIF